MLHGFRRSHGDKIRADLSAVAGAGFALDHRIAVARGRWLGHIEAVVIKFLPSEGQVARWHLGQQGMVEVLRQFEATRDSSSDPSLSQQEIRSVVREMGHYQNSQFS